MTPQDDSSPSPFAAAGDSPVQAAAPATAAPRPGPASTALEGSLERLAGELLVERRRERRWRIFFRLGWLLLAFIVAWGLVSQRAHTSTSSKPHTALIEVRGEIGPDGEASAENLVSALKSAFEDPAAQAIVLRINSPGGSPVQSGIVNDEIRRLKALHEKKVYAVVEEMCASGAYYIAVAADEIFVDKASIVGSIGVLMDGFGFTGLMDKVGVERRLLTAGANKGFLDPFSPQNATHRAYAQEMLNEIHAQFIAVVRTGRGDRLKDTPELFSGLAWSGSKAIQLGLADDFGSLDQVAREVVKAEDIIDYTQHENVASRLAKRFGAGVGESAMHLMQRAVPALR